MFSINSKFWIALLASFVCMAPVMETRARFQMSLFQNDADAVREKIANASRKELPGLYNQLAFHFSFNEADSCFFYAEKALQLALETGDSYQEAQALRFTGLAYSSTSQYTLAIFNLNKSLNILRLAGDQRAVAEVLFDLARVNYDANLFDRMMEINEEMSDMLAESDRKGEPLLEPVERTVLIGMMAISCREAGEYDMGIELMREYFRLYEIAPIPESAHRHFVKSLAEIFEYAGQYDSALKYTLEARKYIPGNEGKPESELTGYEYTQGELHIKLGDTVKGLELCRKGLKDERNGGSHRYATGESCFIGDLLFAMGQKDSALFYYHIAAEEAERFRMETFMAVQSGTVPDVYSGYQYFFNINKLEINERYYRLMAWISGSYYKYYRDKNNWRNALDWHENLSKYRDSLTAAVRNLETRRLQLQFATEQIEQENLLLQSENEIKESKIQQNRLILSAISAFSLLIIIAGWGYLRRSRMKSQQEKLLLEQRLLRAQMNPHFIFNSLGSIQSSILKEEPDKAVRYLSRFSGLIRNILDFSMRETITLQEEVDTISHYLELQKARFGGKFDYIIEVDQRIDTEIEEVPPMLAQPFIENAIEHGIKHKQGKGRIEIRIARWNDCTIFEVEDDGVGRKRAREIESETNETHLSISTSITRERLALINRKSRKKINLAIIDLLDDSGNPSGTKVRFYLS